VVQTAAVDATDAEVMTASINDPRAFATIYDRHAAVLFRFFVRRVGPDTGEALLGELFRIAFERRTAYDITRGDARPWLYGIASNLVARHRRAEARRLRAMAALAPRTVHLDVDDDADAVATTVDAMRTWPRLLAAVAALPPAERDTLVLYAWEDLRYDEIAAALGVPVGTVRSRLNRARRRLRELDVATGEEHSSAATIDRARIGS